LTFKTFLDFTPNKIRKYTKNTKLKNKNGLSKVGFSKYSIKKKTCKINSYRFLKV